MAKRLLSALMIMMITLVFTMPADAAGRRIKHNQGSRSAKRVKKSSSKRIVARSTRSSRHQIAGRKGSKRTVASSRRGKQKYIATRRGRGSKRTIARARSTRRVASNAGGSRYMWSAPWFDNTPYNVITSAQIRNSFEQGSSGRYSPQQLVKAGVFKFQPLSGGIFNRQGSIKHIILHSTETESPADAKRVILSWNNRGRSHPGAQYIVDRNGIIYQTVDPKYGTVHVNVSRTKYGVTNDNSVGIEIVRAGAQKYTQPQMESVAQLVSYLQARYEIGRSKVLAHGYVQPSTRRDPVNFNWTAFNQDLAYLSTGRALASNPDTSIQSVNLAAAQLNRVKLPAKPFEIMLNGITLRLGTLGQAKPATASKPVRLSQSSTFANVNTKG